MPLPELPHEVVSYITSFIPTVIDKISRLDCSEPITKIRSERAKILHNTIIEYFIDQDEEELTIDTHFLHESAVLNTWVTIEALATKILIEDAGWPRSLAIDLDAFPIITFLKARRGYPGVQSYYKQNMTITKIFKNRHRSVYCLL